MARDATDMSWYNATKQNAFQTVDFFQVLLGLPIIQKGGLKMAFDLFIQSYTPNKTQLRWVTLVMKISPGIFVFRPNQGPP